MALTSSQREALHHLGTSTAEVVARTLETFVPDGVERGEVSVTAAGQQPFAKIPFGGIAASVRYIDGVTGANVFMMSAGCARLLATAMGAEAQDGPLTELEMSAIGEATNQMLSAASAALSVVIGQEIAISPPDVRLLKAGDDAADLWGAAPYACSTSFTINGEPCRLVQLIPSGFVVRMTRAMDDLSMQSHAASDLAGAGAPGERDPEHDAPIEEKLGGVTLRLWAELGRTRLALGAALELPDGAVVDLDRTADAPVDLFVNGLCFGHGHLLVTDDGEWAIEVETLITPTVRKPSLVGGTGVTN